MDRLRELASRSKRKPRNSFPFPLPASLSRRNPFSGSRDDMGSAQASMAPARPIVEPASVSNASTQTDDDVRLKPTKMMTSRKKTSAAQRDMHMRLAAAADILEAQTDALAGSGHTLWCAFDETAADVLEAETAIERRMLEVEGLNRQLMSMQLGFNRAHAQLQKAHAFVRSLADRSDSDHVGLQQEISPQTRVELEQAFQRLVIQIQSQDVSTWSRDKVDKILEKLYNVHQANEKIYKFDNVRRDLTTATRCLRDLDFDDKYLPLLVATPDSQDLLQSYRDEDRALVLTCVGYGKTLHELPSLAGPSWERPVVSSAASKKNDDDPAAGHPNEVPPPPPFPLMNPRKDKSAKAADRSSPGAPPHTASHPAAAPPSWYPHCPCLGCDMSARLAAEAPSSSNAAAFREMYRKMTLGEFNPADLDMPDRVKEKFTTAARQAFAEMKRMGLVHKMPGSQ